jgi:hypothetical protein
MPASTLPLRISKTDLRAARLRIVQLRTEAARETRVSARKELLLTAATIEARIARAS